MRKFYMNKNSHEVHMESCKYANKDTQLYLGEFKWPYLAKRAAKKIEADADGCAHCCSRSNIG